MLDSIMRGYRKLASNPGAALKRMKSNASGQANRVGEAVRSVGMAATRGKGLKPARDLGNVMKEAAKTIK